MSTTPQPLPITPPPVVQKNAAGQMIDSQGNPIPQAPAISPDKTSIATGDQGLVWNASGPKMTPQATPAAPAPAPSTDPSQSSPGIFSRIGNFLQQKGPALNDIANHFAAGAGNYKPLQSQEAEKELGIRQQQADLQGKVAQSNLDTQALSRKREQQQIDFARSPEQTAAAALTQNKALKTQDLGLEAPKDIVGASPDGKGLTHYERSFNSATGQWETKPSMVNGQPLNAAPKVAGAPELVPDPASPTGYSQRFTDAYGNEMGRRQGAIPPAALIPSTTSGSNTTLKDDGQGNMVPVTLPHSSTKTPTLPGTGAPPTKPQIPLASGVPSTKPSTGGVKVGGPVMNAKPNADEKKRADLAENLNENFDQLEEILHRRPELFGPVAGRMTGVKNFLGTNDPDIGAIENIKHQVGMAQISSHGMRSTQGIEGASNALLNSFHNGPEATLAALQSARKSVGTFQKDVSQPAHSRGGPEAPPPTMPATSPTVEDEFTQFQNSRKKPQ